MIQQTRGSEIPEQFAIIRKLSSLSMQRALGQMINEIGEILTLSKDIALSPKINNRLENYFKYLSRTTSSLTHLNKWSEWLLIYGVIVRDELNNEYCSARSHPALPTNLEHDEMMDKIALLIELIGNLQSINKYTDEASHGMITESLDCLIKNASKNTYHNGAVYYRKMCDDLDRMVWFYTTVTAENVVPMTLNLTETIIADITKLNGHVRHGGGQRRHEVRPPLVSNAG